MEGESEKFKKGKKGCKYGAGIGLQTNKGGGGGGGWPFLRIRAGGSFSAWGCGDRGTVWNTLKGSETPMQVGEVGALKKGDWNSLMNNE